MKLQATLRIVVLTLCLLSAACARMFPPPNVNKSSLGQSANAVVAPTEAPPQTTEVKITQPADGSTVAHTQTVKGTSRNLPAGHVVWVVVSTGGRFYPQNNAAIVQTDGKWSATVYMGKQPPGDAGRAFEIFAILADKETQAAFEDYLSVARGKNDYAGLEKLPASAKIHDQVSVTRR